MSILQSDIENYAYNHLMKLIEIHKDIDILNYEIELLTGIIIFFPTSEEILEFEKLNISHREGITKSEYGDFQTNALLVRRVFDIIVESNFKPDILIEPTCGIGNFVIQSLVSLPSLKEIIAIELYKPYIWQLKLNIVLFHLLNPNSNKPKIIIIHSDIFNVNLNQLSLKYSNANILLIGNPPWVTNSALGGMDSTNVPKKYNIKNNNGLDAITGKGNFDIAENIIISLINSFKNNTCLFSFLLKNNVVKNIVQEQGKNIYNIASIAQYVIDSKVEFNIAADASLMCFTSSNKLSKQCNSYNIYTNQFLKSFGWIKDKFVSNTDKYSKTSKFDGVSPFIWRQGLKHDCTNVMELTKNENGYSNKKGETVQLEEDLIHGFLKSSDLKHVLVDSVRKHTIVTQKKVGDDTKYIGTSYPLINLYLTNNITEFKNRKSIIYKNKPEFSIFGIGDYSFKPFKVAISGLYKTFHFSLVLPINNKPIMLDDTCYFIGFDKIEFAMFSLILLNSDYTRELLDAITFSDSKRVFTKDSLMRIDLSKIADLYNYDMIVKSVEKILPNLVKAIDIMKWNSYLNLLNNNSTNQTSIF